MSLDCTLYLEVKQIVYQLIANMMEYIEILSIIAFQH